MPERKYSVLEIDRMRNAIRRQFPLVLIGTTLGGPTTLTFEYDAQVEDRLRTYMLNGTDPDELDPAQQQSLIALQSRGNRFEKVEIDDAGNVIKPAP